MPFAIDNLPRELIWGVFTRGLAGVYLISFVSLYHQALPIAGSNGLTPVGQVLNKIRQDFPGIRRFLYFPTVLWLNSSDRFLKSIVLLGIGLAGLVICGAPNSQWYLLGCWVIYLSLDIAVDLIYPWDCLQLESGFLAVFLPALRPIPDLRAVEAPSLLLVFAFHWLLFRVVFGFGKKKFYGASFKDRSYIKSFLINQPIPSPLAWYACRLPTPIFIFLLGGMFFTEVVAPFLIFLPGYPRVTAAAAIVGLMIGIQLFGNFGYFNVLTATLCITLLDYRSTIVDLTCNDLFGSVQTSLSSALVFIVIVYGLVQLPLDSWSNRSWAYWPVFLKLRNPVLRMIAALNRLVTPFRVVNAYGVFPPHCSPAVRWLPVIEAAGEDGVWHEYPFRYIPTFETSPPRFVAPYHPRLDHAVFYESFGMSSRFITSALQAKNPYRCRSVSGLDCLMQRILEGEEEVLSLFAYDPFRGSDNRPVMVRAQCYLYEPTDITHQRATGKWWRRRWVGTHAAVRARDDAVWKRWLPDPELFHWDDLFWKRRSPKLAPLLRSDCESEPVTTSQSDFFWNKFAAAAGQPLEIDLHDFAGVVSAVHSKFTAAELREVERIMTRLAIVLVSKLEPLWCSRQAVLPARSYYQVFLLAHHIIASGRDGYRHALTNPTSAAEEYRRFTTESGLYYPAIVRCEELYQYARKCRITMGIATLEFGGEILGFLELIPFIADRFADPQQDLPLFSQSLETGEWMMHFRNTSLHES